MIYVGVQNSAKKAELARRRPVKTIYVDPQDLAWDCSRHIAFLREAKRHTGDSWDEAWMLRSWYAGWLLTAGRSQDSAIARCRRFLIMFAEIQRDGWSDAWATVTEDGIRLDGSHRAAIAVVLGLPRVPVSVVPYRPADETWRRAMQEYRRNCIQGASTCQNAKEIP